MKPSALYPLRRCAGSTLLATMFFVVSVAFFLIYYLGFVQNSNLNDARAQQWNSALALAEGGIEEGLANLNYVAITPNSNATTFAAFSRSLNGGSYSVNSAATGVVATITSTGIISAPISGDSIARTVRIRAQRQSLFSKGMISMTYIRMNGNTVGADSWDSHDPTKSTNGIYSNYVGTNGDIAAVNGLVNVGNYDIYGDLFLGPNSTYEHGPSGGVTGTIYPDWNMTFPDVEIPTPTDTNGNVVSWIPAPGGNSAHVFTNAGYYTVTDSSAITVKPGVKVTLNVQTSGYNLNNLTIQGGTTNAGTVVMYLESGNVTGSGGAVNNRPENFLFFGRPGVTAVTLSGNSTFVGVIYAPQADLTTSGGGSDDLDFRGSMVVKSITAKGHFKMHYDESLVGVYFGYYAAGYWEEL